MDDTIVKICHARGGDPTYTPGNQTGTELAQGNWSLSQASPGSSPASLSQASPDSSPASGGAFGGAFKVLSACGEGGPKGREECVNPGNGVEVNGERVDPWNAPGVERLPDYKAHVVAWGDTLWDIAQKYGTTVEAICTLNEIDPEKFIYPGQVVVIPREERTNA